MRIYILFTLILSFNLFSQTTTVVDYGVIFDTSNEKDDQLKNSLFFKIISDSQNDIQFELKFNDSLSSFKAKDNLSLNNRNKVKMASGLVVEGEYFRNINSNQIINKAYGLNHSIDNDLEWTILKESKIIDSIFCYKAISEKKIENSKGVFKYPITAWFAPSIPNQFGPSLYGGLPGLIVELHERNFVIFLDKITFNSDKKVDEMPSKNVLTEDEYKKKMKKRFEN
jgi:GLPGLI family protein